MVRCQADRTRRHTGHPIISGRGCKDPRHGQWCRLQETRRWRTGHEHTGAGGRTRGLTPELLLGHLCEIHIIRLHLAPLPVPLAQCACKPQRVTSRQSRLMHTQTHTRKRKACTHSRTHTAHALKRSRRISPEAPPVEFGPLPRHLHVTSFAARGEPYPAHVTPSRAERTPPKQESTPTHRAQGGWRTSLPAPSS